MPETPHLVDHPSADLATLSEAQWTEAKRREAVIRPLAALRACPVERAEAAAKALGLSRRHIYTLIRDYRASGELLTALVPGQSQGGQGKSRLPAAVDDIISEAIEDIYLNRQKAPVSRVVEEVRRWCLRAGLKPPSDNAVRRRIQALPEAEVIRRREGAKAARAKTRPLNGPTPESPYPLAIMQMDHTPVDLILVDETCRQPIGRPYLTLAIDVFSRCIAGFHLSLEAPSAVSVGLCLTHAVLDKAAWLAEREIESEWPIWGKPQRLAIDNAAEFHSEALRRGCEQHGIALDFRPVGQPHYGGIIERVIGTFMQLVHDLPGTTFSDVAERGDYPSESRAVMTLAELERWMTVAIIDYYHRKPHAGLDAAPLDRYRDGIEQHSKALGTDYPPKPGHAPAFVIDFLPVIWRSLQRQGFRIDHIDYYSDALRPLIGKPDQGKFLIRRDPRDLSLIYVLEPGSQQYLEVPYRTLARPGITLWEHRQALKRLRERGLERIDEAAIFQAVEEMRRIVREAAGKTRTARRQSERRRHAEKPQERQSTSPGATRSRREGEADPFEDIEPW